jgi:hypothetical protein
VLSVAKPKAAAKKAVKPVKAKPAAKSAVKSAPKTAKAPVKAARKAEPPKPKLPAVAVKPKKATAPSIPLPPPPPPPPAHRDEMIAPRDIGRLLRYGEQFGAHRIDVRMLPLQLPAASGALAVQDPLVPKSFRVYDRPVVAGTFRVMLSIAKSSDKSGNKERFAAIVIHVGRPPIAKWTVAHFAKQKKPKSADDLPRVDVTGDYVVLIDAGKGSPGAIAVGAPAAVAPPPPGTPGPAPLSPSIAPVEVPLTDGRRALALPSGDGSFAAYWGVDAEDKAVCLVLDFETFTQKDWKARPSS